MKILFKKKKKVIKSHLKIPRNQSMILLLLTLNYATFFSFSEHDFSIHFIYRDKIKQNKAYKTYEGYTKKI